MTTAAVFAALLAPFSGVTVDTIMDTPVLARHELCAWGPTELRAGATGVTLTTEDGRQVLVTEEGFRLALSAEMPAGDVSLAVHCMAPSKGADSYFVELDGTRVPHLLVPPTDRFGDTSVTLRIDEAGEHSVVLTLREAPGSRIESVTLSSLQVTPPRPPMQPSLREIHPRLLLTSETLDKLRSQVATPGASPYYEAPESLTRRPPEYVPGKRNGGAFRTLGNYALAYRLRPDPALLDSLLEWLRVATTYGDVGVDLDAEYFMEGVALTYDWLYEDIPRDLRADVRRLIADKARTVFSASLAGHNGGGHSYQQNHYWFSHLALALGAAAIVGEEPEADRWLAWAWDRFERIALTFSPEGSFHEGPSYWDFSMPTLYTFVDLYESLSGMRVPGDMDRGLRGQGVFRFQYVLPGFRESAPLEDSKQGLGVSRTCLYLWEAKRFQDPVTAALPRVLGRKPSNDRFNLLWFDTDLPPAEDPLDKLPLGTCYLDIGTAFMRTDWTENATYAAFVARPLGGFRYAELCDRFGIGGTGHNHPAQNHFFLYAAGQVFAADPGYTYEKKTCNHNTVLVDGQGQVGDGEMWPRPKPGRAHLLGFAQAAGRCIVTGSAASAYPADLGVTQFDRTLVLASADFAVVFDRLSADAPRTFTWLLNHWGTVESGQDSWSITRGETVLSLYPKASAPLTAAEQTRRPQYVHPTRNLTPENADLEQLTFQSPPVRRLTLAVPLVVNSAGASAAHPTCEMSDNMVAVTFKNTVVVFNLTAEEIAIPLPGRDPLRSAARTVLITMEPGQTPQVLAETPLAYPGTPAQ